MSENFLRKYGVWEYMLFIFGGILLGRTAYEIIMVNFEETNWEYWLINLGLASVGALFVGKPLSILDFGRKKLGLEPKKEQ